MACVAVLVTEMVNTAVESVVDMVTQAYHPLAKLAKDIAAGAVLISAMAAAVVGAILFISQFEKIPPKLHLAGADNYDALLSTSIVLGVLLLLVTAIVKMVGGKGSILQGGIVSGHSVVAFMLASLAVRLSGGFNKLSIIALLLAAMVAQCRVEGKMHSVREVVVGGLLGIVVTAGVYFLKIGAH